MSMPDLRTYGPVAEGMSAVHVVRVEDPVDVDDNGSAANWAPGSAGHGPFQAIWVPPARPRVQPSE
jgi:hypothetical protein